MRPRLRLFTGDDEADTLTSPEPQISVRLGDITHILADAYRRERNWLMDFEDDQVQVSPDLYEVLSAYWRLRPSA
jgi:hypothetical protein